MVCALACGGGSVAVDPLRSSVTVDRASGVADGVDAVVVGVTVRDAKGNPVQGVDVSFSSSGTGNSELPGFRTQRDGRAEVRLHSTVAEGKTVTVSASLEGKGVELNDKPTVSFRAGPAAAVRFVQQPTRTQAGQPITPPVSLRTFDMYGNAAVDPPLSVTLRLVRSSGGSLGGDVTQLSRDGGVTFAGLLINRVQTGYALRAELQNGGAVESMQFDVVAGPPAQGTSSVAASPVNVQADNVATTTVTVTVKDVGGNPLGAQAVSLAVSGTGNTLGSSSGMTDGAGVFSTTLRSSVAELKTVTATVAGLSPLTTQVTFIP